MDTFVNLAEEETPAQRQGTFQMDFKPPSEWIPQVTQKKIGFNPGHMKYVAVVIGLVIIAMMLFYLLNGNTTASPYTTTSPGSTANATTTMPYPNSYFISIAAQANQTSGILTPANTSWGWILYAENKTYLNSIYGANFTVEFIDNNSQTFFTVPQQYANITTPFVLSILIWNNSNSVTAQSRYGKFEESLMGGTASDIGEQSFTWNGTEAGLARKTLVFLYRTYVVEVDTYGNVGRFVTSNYTYAVANYTYGLLSR